MSSRTEISFCFSDHDVGEVEVEVDVGEVWVQAGIDVGWTLEYAIRMDLEHHDFKELAGKYTYLKEL